MLKVRKYQSKYTGTIYNKLNSNYKERFSCSEELLDFRYQIACTKEDGYYVVFDFDENEIKCELDSDGGISYHPENYFSVNLITRAIHNLQQNDIHNIEPKNFY